MRPALLVALFIACSVCRAETPEDAVTEYFQAMDENDTKRLLKVVHEPSALRIGKSIIAASPMFFKRDDTAFFEMIFGRVPTPKEVEEMSPMQVFAEYMCDPPEQDPKYRTKRTILGSLAESDSMVHVVYRVDGLPNLAEKHRDVLTCVNLNGEWKVVVSRRVWDAYMAYTLLPAMARLSDGEILPTDDVEKK